MRSHISAHRATTKYFSNSFVFKTKIEKEGLPGDSTPDLGAGGPEFKSRRPDQNISRVFLSLLEGPFTPIPVCGILADRSSIGVSRLVSQILQHGEYAKNTERLECHSEIIELTQLKKSSRDGCGENWGDLAHFSFIILLKDTTMGHTLNPGNAQLRLTTDGHLPNPARLRIHIFFHVRRGSPRAMAAHLACSCSAVKRSCQSVMVSFR